MNQTELKDEIKRIDDLISKYYDTLLRDADTFNVARQEVDDKQIKINTEYQPLTQIRSMIHYLEQTKQSLINKLEGRGTYMIPKQNL